MNRAVQLYNGGRWHDLTRRYTLLRIDGLHDFDVRRNAEALPRYHGLYDYGYGIGAREFDLVFVVSGCVGCSLPQARRDFAALWTPRRSPLTLHITESDGVTRAVDAHKIGMMGYERKGNSVMYAITLRVHNGIALYDPTERCLQYDTSYAGVASCYPFCVPMCIPPGALTLSRDVCYEGDYPSRRVRIDLIGQMDSPRIALASGAAWLDYNVSLAAGQTLSINVRDGVATDTNGQLIVPTIDSDPNGLALYPDGWELPSGDTASGNTVLVTAQNFGANSAIRLCYQAEYLTL